MSTIEQEVFSILNDAFKNGELTSEEKASIKEMIVDENGIALEFVEEYSTDKDKKKLIKSFRDYLKSIESDDEDTKEARRQLLLAQSPEDQLLMNIKQQRLKDKEPKDDDEGFANFEECEEGLSPKVIFDKKK